jgi:GDPmannose 4,6-dehydratase
VARRALVTGATGQTGSYLVTSLQEHDWQVHAVIRPGDPAAVADGIVAHVADLAVEGDVAEVIARVAPDAVFNLGGVSSVAASWAEPALVGRVCALAVGEILQAAWEVQTVTQREVAVVQASSSEIFGAADESPQAENTPVRPLNPYGAAKAYGHHMVGVYRARGLRASSCILFNHESPRRPPNFVTRKITRRVAEISLGRAETLELGNIEARRDWGWAPDYAEALRLAADHSEDFVVATGVTHSVRDFAIAAFRAAGVSDGDARITQDQALLRPTDAAHVVGDSTRLRQRTGWAPTLEFEGIVAAMVAADLDQLRAEEVTR